MKSLIEKEKIETALSGKTLEEIERLLEEDGIKTGVYGDYYKVNTELREKFPDSYFYSEIYDEAIRGVNVITGSIIYELQHLGYLHTVHVEGHYGSLKDRLECGGIESCKINLLTPEDLKGKVPPTVILLDDDMKELEFVRRYITRKRP